MPSELKSETARINGAKSHGPKTPEGKEKSSQNAIKHGMTSRNTYILECESADEFQRFFGEHLAIHQPATPPEKELVEQMAIARWRIRRFVNAETVLIDCEIVRNRDKVEKEFATLGCDVHVAMAIRSLADESRCLSLMSRYEARHQRCHDKAYAALRDLQKSRMPVVPPPAASPAQPDPAQPATDPASSLARPDPVPPATDPDPAPSPASEPPPLPPNRPLTAQASARGPTRLPTAQASARGPPPIPKFRQTNLPLPQTLRLVFTFAHPQRAEIRRIMTDNSNERAA